MGTGSLGRTGRADEEGVSPSVSMLECLELCLGMDGEPTEISWVRTEGRAGTIEVIMGICYRPPDQEDLVDETLYRQIGAASHS